MKFLKEFLIRSSVVLTILVNSASAGQDQSGWKEFDSSVFQNPSHFEMRVPEFQSIPAFDSYPESLRKAWIASCAKQRNYQSALRDLEEAVVDVSVRHPDSLAIAQEMNSRLFDLFYAEAYDRASRNTQEPQASQEFLNKPVPQAQVEAEFDHLVRTILGRCEMTSQGCMGDSQDPELPSKIRKAFLDPEADTSEKANLREQFFVIFKSTFQFVQKEILTPPQLAAQDRKDKVNRVNSYLSERGKTWDLDPEWTEREPFERGAYSKSREQFRRPRHSDAVAASEPDYTHLRIPLSEREKKYMEQSHSSWIPGGLAWEIYGENKPSDESWNSYRSRYSPEQFLRDSMKDNREWKRDYQKEIEMKNRLATALKENRITPDQIQLLQSLEQRLERSMENYIQKNSSIDPELNYFKGAEASGLNHVAGISSTTDTIMTLSHYLRLDSRENLLKLRLALLGWLVDGGNHSVHEVLISGRSFYLEYSIGPDFYQDLYPLDPEFARKVENQYRVKTQSGQLPKAVLESCVRNEIFLNLRTIKPRPKCEPKYKMINFKPFEGLW